MKNIIQSAEAVRAGHPDKICDFLADEVLDRYIELDPDSRVAVEVMGTGNQFIFGGEVCSRGQVTDTELQNMVKNIMEHFDYPPDDICVTNLIQPQSVEINGKVGNFGISAGDMGITYGYAENDTDSMLPPCYEIATNLMYVLDRDYKNWDLGILADGKCIVTTYGNQIMKIVMAVQAEADADKSEIYRFIEQEVIDPIVQHGGYTYAKDYRFVLDCDNFTIGGTIADTGLTGRKIQNDTYGTNALNGGGSFSGKDMTKVDRSGAYYARWLALRLCTEGICKRCQIMLNWQLGQPTFTDIVVNDFNTCKDKDAMVKALERDGGMSLTDIIKTFSPSSFSQITNYGHFTDCHEGDPSMPWEEPKFENVMEEY